MENDKELCSKKILSIAKNSYSNVKEFLKNEANQKMFFVIILAIVFAIIIGIIIGSRKEYSMRKTILLCVIVSIPLILLAIMFPRQFIAILSVFSVVLLILGNRLTDTIYEIGYNIVDVIVWTMNNISNITLKYLKIDINFQENLQITRDDVENSYDSRRLQTHYQNEIDGVNQEVITNVLDSYKSADEKKQMKQMKNDIIELEKEVENIYNSYVDNIESSANQEDYEASQLIDYTNDSSITNMKQLRELYDDKLQELDNIKRLFQDKYGKYDIIRFDLQGNKLPSVLPIYNRPNKYTYGSASYIPTYEDQIVLSASKSREPQTQFTFYQGNKCLIYDDFSKTL